MADAVMATLGGSLLVLEIAFYVLTVRSLAYRQSHVLELPSRLVLVRVAMHEQQRIR